MLKRTKGRILLALLVTTGLAGTINEPAISMKERKRVVTELKETRADLVRYTQGLTDRQLKFRSNDISIEGLLRHQSQQSQQLWLLFETTMQAPINPEKRRTVLLSDDAVYDLGLRNGSAAIPPSGSNAKGGMLNRFYTERAEQIKYARTTTEDLRNRVVAMPFGNIDAYQLLLYIAGCSRSHLNRIADIRESAAFTRL